MKNVQSYFSTFKAILVSCAIFCSFSAFSQVDTTATNPRPTPADSTQQAADSAAKSVANSPLPNAPAPTPTDTSYWDKGGVVNLTFNQVTLTNWAAGGLNTISVTGLLSLHANYEKDKETWDNSLDIGYGITRQGDNAFLKNDDRIELVSKYGRKFSKKLSFSGMLNFRTQMAPGFQFPENDSIRISDFMAPGYLLGGLGIEYRHSKMFNMSISPVSSKITFVLDQGFADRGNFGVEAAEVDTNGNIITPGKNIRVELGGMLRANFTKNVMKNITITSRLDLFSNYIENPQNIDVNWETLIVMKINKYISANFGVHLIYDDDIDIEVDDNNDGVVDAVGPRLQVKQVFGAGLNVKF